MQVRLAGRVAALFASAVLAAAPGWACVPSQGPAPSGGGTGGAMGGPSGGGDSGRGVGVGGPGGGGAWGGGDNSAAAQGARSAAANAAGGDLNPGDDSGPRRSGGGGQQQSGNYTSQIDSLTQSAAQGQQGGDGGWQDLPPPPAKTPCDALVQEVESARQMLFDFDIMHSSEASDLKSKQQALQNLTANGAPHPAQEVIDQQLVFWTGALNQGDDDLRSQAKAMVTWLGQLKLTGTSDATPVINYYQQAVAAGQALAAETAAQRKPMADSLAFLQGQLKDCQSQ